MVKQRFKGLVPTGYFRSTAIFTTTLWTCPAEIIVTCASSGKKIAKTPRPAGNHVSASSEKNWMSDPLSYFSNGCLHDDFGFHPIL